MIYPLIQNMPMELPLEFSAVIRLYHLSSKLDSLEASADLFRFSSRWPCRFGCDTLISRFQWVEITENCEELAASQKTNFLYFPLV